MTDDWKSIDSAPKDGTVILLKTSDSGIVWVGRWWPEFDPDYPWWLLDFDQSNFSNGWMDGKYGPTYWKEIK